MTPRTVAEVRAFLAQRREREREAVAGFVAAVASGDVVALGASIEPLALTGTWRAAMRQVARRGVVHPDVPPAWLRRWIAQGDGIRSDVNDDAALLDALRVLLPPYQGPALMLYRGDSAGNRRRRTYGPSWSARQAVAEGFARGTWRACQGGSVVVRTLAPPAAIVCAAHTPDDDEYEEAEYLVDRRKLGHVEVVRRFAEVALADLALADVAEDGVTVAAPGVRLTRREGEA